MSYSSFSFSDLSVAEVTSHDESFQLEVSITVKNTGPVTGSGVVQLYISYPDTGITTPRLQLKGFAKARDLASGSAQKVIIPLDKYAVSFYDTTSSAWSASAGTYSLFVGHHCEDLPLEGSFKLQKSFYWTGL